MAYRFEWDASKAAENLRKHGVSFDEAITVFGDPLNLLMPDPDHSVGDKRYFFSARRTGNGCSSWLSPSDLLGPASSPRGGRTHGSGGSMKKKASRPRASAVRDTLRAHYDFSKAVRGSTAAKYARGANVMVIDPSVLDVFPDGVAVNETLRALAPVLRQKRRRRSA